MQAFSFAVLKKVESVTADEVLKLCRRQIDHGQGSLVYESHKALYIGGNGSSPVSGLRQASRAQ